MHHNQRLSRSTGQKPGLLSICRTIADTLSEIINHQGKYRAPQNQETYGRHRFATQPAPKAEPPGGPHENQVYGNHHLAVTNKQCSQASTNHRKPILATPMKATLLISTIYVSTTCQYYLGTSLQQNSSS